MNRAAHQHDPNATAPWRYFQSVITWVETTFTTYRKEMKGVAWGPLYGTFGKETLDTAKFEAEVARLMQDRDVTKKSGIYEYVLSGNERALNIRQFDDNDRREAMPTISHLGAKAARRWLKTAGCFASRTIERRAVNSAHVLRLLAGVKRYA